LAGLASRAYSIRGYGATPSYREARRTPKESTPTMKARGGCRIFPAISAEKMRVWIQHVYRPRRFNIVRTVRNYVFPLILISLRQMLPSTT
jgi:hypothetical protein